MGEAGATIAARNSHSLHVVSVPGPVSDSDSDSVSSSPPSSVPESGEKADSSGGGGANYLVLFGGSSPELGPLGDAYYAELPAHGITSKCVCVLLSCVVCCTVLCYTMLLSTVLCTVYFPLLWYSANNVLRSVEL